MKMTKEKHIERHIFLHKSLDELVADFINHTKNLPSETTIMELLKWSSDQIDNPTEEGK